MTDFSDEFLERWVAIGSVEECVAHLQNFVEAGATRAIVRLRTAIPADRSRITERSFPEGLTGPPGPLR